MFKILKKVTKQKDIKVPVFKFGVEVQNHALEWKDSQNKEKVSTDFKCDLCNYKANKITTLRKHINSKHTKQKWKWKGFQNLNAVS